MSRIDNEPFIERVEPRNIPTYVMSPKHPARPFPHVRLDDWFVGQAEEETQKLAGLNRELAEHKVDLADMARSCWDEQTRDLAERLGRRLHSKVPGPIASALRLTSAGTRLLIREWHAVAHHVYLANSSLQGVDRVQALNLMGISFPCRGINWDIDPPKGVDNNPDRVNYVMNFIEVQITKLQAKLPDLDRIDEKLRARAINGQPASDDKTANRIRREITASEKTLRWYWSEVKKMETQQGVNPGDAPQFMIANSQNEANPAMGASNCDTKPIPPVEGSDWSSSGGVGTLPPPPSSNRAGGFPAHGLPESSQSKACTRTAIVRS